MNKRAVIFCILWLVSAFILFYLAMILDLSQNLFSWRPELDILSLCLVSGIIVLLVLLFFLAKYTRGRIETWFSLLVVSALFLYGFVVLYYFYTEHVSSDLLGRSVVSPHWFRVSMFLIFVMPLIYWFIFPFARIKKSLQ